MTFEQLRIFVAVAQREHLTRAAEIINLTPSAVSAAIKNLETYYGVELFHRVGRRIELTATGRIFLDEARATLARARAAELTLAELGGLQRGTLNVAASQTIASYWLPPVLMRFHDQYPRIEINLAIGNTRNVSDAILNGTSDLGFIEGEIDEPALLMREIAKDALMVIVAPNHDWAHGHPLTFADLVTQTSWVLRETGSGTRSEFENALRREGVSPADLNIVMTFPSNESVISAAAAGNAAAVVSSSVALPFIEQGRLCAANITLPERSFMMLHHKERHHSRAASVLADIALTEK
ncbi:LysR family transcriptional regulator [Thalassospira profundimaris]|uniref:LysR family transcriptional regulator n=1 Tax=Thalassospira profundimaris TaxID=502049 RepID=A0A367XIY3_9PROT|nr:LysR family transcriptional regulator [Thalassospira profundimaris]RCK53623.1 LysR family transcriptional regulator [Thalassospira profundimaris]